MVPDTLYQPDVQPLLLGFDFVIYITKKGWRAGGIFCAQGVYSVSIDGKIKDRGYSQLGDIAPCGHTEHDVQCLTHASTKSPA
jgi:hypothetical protein